MFAVILQDMPDRVTKGLTVCFHNECTLQETAGLGLAGKKRFGVGHRGVPFLLSFVVLLLYAHTKMARHHSMILCTCWACPQVKFGCTQNFLAIVHQLC